MPFLMRHKYQSPLLTASNLKNAHQQLEPLFLKLNLFYLILLTTCPMQSLEQVAPAIVLIALVAIYSFQ